MSSLLFKCLVSLSASALYAQQHYFGVMYTPHQSSNGNFEAAALNFSNGHSIDIGGLFASIKRADGCYQLQTTYFWTYADIYDTSVYTIDLAGDMYEFVSFPNYTVNFYCLQLIDYPAGAVTISYDASNDYQMEIFWVFESPIEDRAKPYRMPVSNDFVSRNYSIITGMVQNFGTLIIFYQGIGANYEYAIYDVVQNTIALYGDAECAFGNGVYDTFYVPMQLYSYFITQTNGVWYIGQLMYDANTFNVTGCKAVNKFEAIPTTDTYYSGDISEDGTEIVVLTSSGVYYLNMTASASKEVTLPNNVNTTRLGSINFAIDID